MKLHVLSFFINIVICLFVELVNPGRKKLKMFNPGIKTKINKVFFYCKKKKKLTYLKQIFGFILKATP